MAITRITEKHGTGNTNLGGFIIPLTGFVLSAGDILVVSITCGDLTAAASMSASGNHSGALTDPHSVYSNDTNDTNLYAGLAIQGATVDTSITVSGIGNGTSAVVWSVVQYSGVSNSTPNDVATVTATGGNTDAANPGAITPVTSGTVVAAVYAAAQATSTAWTPPGGIIGNFVQTASTGKGRIATGDGSWTSGAFDPPAVTGGDGSTADSWAAVTFALRVGSNTYNDTISEGITTGDSYAAAATFAPTISEGVTAGDSYTATATFVTSLSEGVTLGDGYPGGSLFNNSITEGISVGDSVSYALTFGATISEGVTLGDSAAAVATFRPAYSESLALSDTYAGGLTFSFTYTEGVTLGDGLTTTIKHAIDITSDLIKAITWTLDRPAGITKGGYSGARSLITRPWHAKWTAHVDLAAVQGEANVAALRAFLGARQGQINSFRLQASAAAQNSNSGVTISVAAAAGATSASITGAATTLKDGQQITIMGQLLVLTADQSGATITFEPPLRQAAPLGTVVVTQNPYIRVSMIASSLGYTVAPGRVFSISFDCEEAVLESDGTPPES